MKDDKVTGLGNGGEKTIYERDGPMLTSGRESTLDFKSPSMVSISHWYRRKGCEAVGKFPVIGRGSGRVAEFKGDGRAYDDLSLCCQGCERRGDRGFRKPSEDAGIHQEPRPRHSKRRHPTLGRPRRSQSVRLR